MKANKAPEKIYLQEPTKVRTEKKYDNDVEYIRTDTFIDKACEWIKEHSYDYLEFGEAGFGADFHYPKMIEDFRKAMKGEQQ